MSELIERIAELKKQGRIFCIATVVDAHGATPRKAGARGLIFPDGTLEGTVGGGNIELEAIQVAQQVLQSKTPRLRQFDLQQLEVGGMVCGGSMTIFFEPVLPERLLTVFGGGHVGRAIARVATEAGWRVRVVDERSGVLDPQYFPASAELIAEKYSAFIQRQSFGPNDWLVIVTPMHQHDEQVLEAVIESPAAYIGMMGSPRKVKEVMSSLRQKGIPEHRLQAVHAPIGLNIGTETPGEIAVSIVAEMMAALHKITDIKSCSRA